MEEQQLKTKVLERTHRFLLDEEGQEGWRVWSGWVEAGKLDKSVLIRYFGAWGDFLQAVDELKRTHGPLIVTPDAELGASAGIAAARYSLARCWQLLSEFGVDVGTLDLAEPAALDGQGGAV